METHTMNDSHQDGSCKTPITDLLRGVPVDQRLIIDHGNITHCIPVGRLCHEAADEIFQLKAELKRCQETVKEPDERLLEIYNLFPRRAARPAALQAIKRAIKKVGYDQLKAHVEAYAAYHKANQIDLQYTPMAATWFNQERWNDTPVVVTPKAPPVQFGRIQYLRQQISESPAFPGGRYFADHTRQETKDTLKRNLEELLQLSPNEDLSRLRA